MNKKLIFNSNIDIYNNNKSSKFNLRIFIRINFN